MLAPIRFARVLILSLATYSLGCGARSALRDPSDASLAIPIDAPRDVLIDTPRDVPLDTPRDVPLDTPRDVPVDVPRDTGPDVLPRVTVSCPAPVFTTQTRTENFAARASHTLGRPMTYAWTVERAPMGSVSVPMPADQTAMRFTFDTGGEWLFRFTARDADGNSDTCTVRAEAEAAIELLCPNDQSNFQGATVPLEAQVRSRLGRPVTVRWEVESRPVGSTAIPQPADRPTASFLLDALGDWSLRLTAQDSNGLTATCRTRVHADPDVLVQCPADTVSRPFSTIVLEGMASSRLGLPLTYRWEIVQQPITSTAVLGTPDARTTPFTFDVAGNWTWRFTATNSQGNTAFCTTRARSASEEAVRVEIVWNVDRSCRSCNAQGGGIDIDLHLADVAQAMGRWAGNAPERSDCYYANCTCRAMGSLCTGTESYLPDWPPTGTVNNPQLDVDHINDLPGPENINVVRAEAGREFDVGVHYYGGQEPTPVVARVYCGGSVVFESEPVRLERGVGGRNNLWRVGRITTTAGGCTFTRCGAPGMLTGCIAPIND